MKRLASFVFASAASIKVARTDTNESKIINLINPNFNFFLKIAKYLVKWLTNVTQPFDFQDTKKFFPSISRVVLLESFIFLGPFFKI